MIKAPCLTTGYSFEGEWSNVNPSMKISRECETDFPQYEFSLVMCCSPLKKSDMIILTGKLCWTFTHFLPNILLPSPSSIPLCMPKRLHSIPDTCCGLWAQLNQVAGIRLPVLHRDVLKIFLRRMNDHNLWESSFMNEDFLTFESEAFK